MNNYVVLGSVISSIFYEDLLQKFGSCGVTLAIGGSNRGKSKSVELSLSAVGCRGAMYTSISDALIRKLLLGAMPWCYDDPEDANQLERMLISVFGGCNIGNASKHGSTRVSPIATANIFIVDELASRDERLFIATL